MRHAERREQRARRVLVPGALLGLLAVVLAVGGCAPSSSGVARATATSTPASRDRPSLLARQAIGDQVQQLETSYDPASQKLRVTATVAGKVPRTPAEISASHERVMALCFQVQRALWTGGVALRDVKVSVLGPLYDDYFDLITDWYGGAELTAAKAATLGWGSATANGAWQMYDIVWLRSSFVPFENWGVTPTATSATP